jgi:hypothetical protein
VWTWNVAIAGHENVEYERSCALGGLFAMSRGRCRTCHEPIWEKGERAILPFAMVMTEPLLPELKPNTDIFYDSGLQQGPTAPTVIRTDFGSLLYELYVIVFVAIPWLPWSILQRFIRGQNKGPGKQTKLS